METINPVQENGKVVTPSVETLQQWIKKDMDAAVYFLNLLRKYPDILATLAQELHAKALQEKHDKEILDHD